MSDYVKDVREHQNGWQEGAASRDAEVAELRAQLARVKEERDLANENMQAAVDAIHAAARAGNERLDTARRELDAVRAANESVAVCAEYTSRVIGDGCLVCELDAVRERVRAVLYILPWRKRDMILRALDGGGE